MPEIKEAESKCIRCDRVVQTVGEVENRNYRTLHYANGQYLAICDECFDKVEGRSFA